MNPKVSIIVPVYNAERTLRRCVDSILCQTFQDYEIILIDDGSIDGSSAICDEYAENDSRVKVFHKVNGGVSSARNKGLEAANGDWITFCDADDRVSPEWLENYAYGLNRGSDNCDLVVQSFIPSGKTMIKDWNPSFDYEGSVKGLVQNLAQRHCVGYPWAKLFRASIIKENGIRFSEDLALREDEEFVYHYLSFVRDTFATSKRGYYYDYPFFEKKYKNVDTFYVDVRVIGSLLELGINDGYFIYSMERLFMAFFYSFRRPLSFKEVCKRTSIVKGFMKRCDMSVYRISKFSKAILHLPVFLAVLIFKVKSMLRKD